MLDLVGNPNCWFSHAQAQIFYDINEAGDTTVTTSTSSVTLSIMNMFLPYQAEHHRRYS